jgi:hypothetical protein
MVSACKRKTGSYPLPDKKMLDYKYQSGLRQALDYKICFFKWCKVDKISGSLFI